MKSYQITLVILLIFLLGGCQPAAQDLEVSSEPSGASVMLDGTARGFTPLTITDLEARRYDVIIALDGHKTVSSKVTIGKGPDSVKLRVVLNTFEPAETGKRSF